MSTLTADRVNELFADSLYADDDLTPEEHAAIDKGEAPEGAIVVDMIVSRVAFDPKRLNPKRDEIVELLNELPVEFLAADIGGGGGWSFLNACMDKHDNQWTSLHQTMGMLFAMGIGIGAAKYVLPREMWRVLPGGMPYVVVTERA